MWMERGEAVLFYCMGMRLSYMTANVNSAVKEAK